MMFNFLKSKRELKAPISGRIIDLTLVEDECFSKKMMGDGIAIEPTSDMIVAPADGKVTAITPTLHAVGLTLDDGLEVLIHVGIDTVKLKGEGFTLLVKENQEVKKGTPLISFNRSFIESKGMSIVTPIVIPNSSMFKKLSFISEGDAIVNETTIITY